ncbi:MAG: VanZ family protein [Nocardioides sp.]
MRRASLAAAFAAYVGFMLLIVLAPTSEVPSRVVLEATEIGQRLGVPEVFLIGTRVEFALNTALVVPVALLGSLVWPALTWRDWLAVGFVGAGTVELLQGLALPERSATFADIVANALGAGLGAMAVAAVRWLSARAPT